MIPPTNLEAEIISASFYTHPADQGDHQLIFRRYTYVMNVPHQAAGFAHPPRNVGALGIEPGMSVADFGSGSGAYILLMAEALGNSGHAYAIDVQKDLLRRTFNEARRKNLSTVKVLWGDLERPNGSKLADDALDLVLISNLLFQVDQKAAVIAEAYRILRARGKLAIIDWTESFGGMGPDKRAVFPKDQARAAAESAGFAFDKEFAAGAHHYGLIFRKP